MIALSGVVAHLQKELGSFFVTEAHPDMYRYINSAINYIYNRRDWQWNRKTYTFTYSNASIEVQLPFFAQKIYVAKLGNVEQYVLNSEEWFTLDDHSLSVGVFGDMFISDTTGTYKIMYAKTAPYVTATDTQIDLPPFFEDALHAVAIHFAYKDIKDYSTAGALIGQANAILDSVTERTTDTRPRQVVRLGSNHSF